MQLSCLACSNRFLSQPPARQSYFLPSIHLFVIFSLPSLWQCEGKVFLVPKAACSSCQALGKSFKQGENITERELENKTWDQENKEAIG